MDLAQLETLLPGLGAFGTFGTAVLILVRMIGHDRSQLAAADARYQQEAKDHAETKAKLDEQMELRRQAEDMVAKLGRKVDALIEQVQQQSQQIATQSVQIKAQTERIQHLEKEVARLNHAGATAEDANPVDA